jgi:hypothetical protein
MRARRALVVILGCVAMLLSAFALYRFGPSGRWLPGCIFHRLTGLECPGCGMTRAVHAMLHGDARGAFRFNPLGMVLLPAALLGIGLELAGWVRGRPLAWRFRAGGPWAWCFAALLLGFWVLRNIPAWPFTLLAPP